MSDFESAMIYKSPSIVERRRRILRVTREMIAEYGYEGLSMRALTARVGVAQRTLYKAFDSKENIVAAAIAEYQREFDEKAVYLLAPDTLEGRMEQLVKIHTRNLQIRPYASATMAIYNSFSLDPTIRMRMQKMALDHLWPFAEALSASGELADHVSAAHFAERATSFGYATLTEWVRRAVSDDALVSMMVETFLMTVITYTRCGSAHAEATAWLSHVRNNDERWLAFRAAAENWVRTKSPRKRDKPANPPGSIDSKK